MKKFFYLLIAMLCCSIVGFAQNYSESFGTGNGDGRRMDNIDFITSRETKTINVNFDTNKTSYEIYNDSFVNEENKINIYKGETFDLTIKGNLNWIYTQVYIDWNCDGSFDESESGTEKLGFQPSTERNFGDNISEGNGSSRTYNITVPDDALLGQTRLRVIMGWKQENVSLVPDGETKEQQFITSTTIDNKKNAIVRDFLLEIKEMHSRTITVASNNEVMGSAVITDSDNTSITTNKIGVSVTATTTEANLYTFEYWSDGNGNIVSKENPFIYTGENDITLTANFNYGPYPEMKRKYQTANQQNRYLKKVSYFIGDEEKTVFEATTQAELPYTAMPTPVTTATTVGALIDKTTTKIVLPQGTTEFKIKFNAWTPQINGYNQELVWTSQAYYIDFDHSLSFEGNTDGVNEISDIAGSSGDENNFGDSTGSADNGWTRTITLPSNLAPDTYRMRVVYYDGSNWSTTLFTTLNGTIQSGIAYDFDIVIEGTEPTVRRVTVNANPAEGGSVRITSPANITENTVETSEPVTVVAEANPGYRFINWTNGQGTVSTNPEYTYRGMNGVTLTANFSKVVNRYAQTTKKSSISANSYVERLEVNDKILGDWSSFTDDNRSNQITLAAWVNFESSSYYADGMAIMGHYQGHYVGKGTTPSFTVSASSNGKMGIFSRTRNNSGGYPGTSSSTINEIDIPQGWFHLALTAKLDGSNIVYKLYVNGEETSASKTVPGNENSNLPYLPDNTDGLGCVLSFGGDMNCKFDDIMIWTEAISPEEVKEAMKGYTDAELASMTTLVGYYTCDDMLENQGTSKNLGSNKTYDLKLQNLKIKALNPPTTGQKEPIAEANLATYIQESERDVPRGGEKLFEGDADANWLTNGDEANFGYIVKTGNTKRLAYNGISKVALADDVLAVYHNGDPGLPTFVKNTDIKTNEDLAVNQIEHSYVAAGLEYTMTMPSVAKTEWMPISLPVDVDLVSDGTYILRPGYNFWYAQVKDDYTSIDSENDIWKTVTSDTKDYVLKPGIISVPENRKGKSFTFYTKLDVPVVIRSFNSEFNKTLMPTPGTIKYIQNPYSFQANSLNMAGIYPEKQQTNKAITVYRFNKATGNFDPLEQVNGNAKAILNAFEPFFVHDSNNGVSQAPRYIGTKDVSGIVEFKAVYDVNVRGTENAVEVETFQNTGVQIYTLDGVMVATDEVEGTKEFELPAGIYIVKTNVEGENKSFKVVVE